MSAPGPPGQPGAPASPPGGGGININFLPSTAAIRSALTSQVTPMAIHWFGMAFVTVVILWLITLVDFYRQISSIAKYFLSFFPNLGLMFAIQIFFQYERSCNKKNLFFNLYEI
jgi:apolipoprotein N-acyltransferase